MQYDLLVISLSSAVALSLATGEASAEECRPFGYQTCSIVGWCLNWCNQWENAQTGETKDRPPGAQVIQPVYRYVEPTRDWRLPPLKFDRDYEGVMSIFRLSPQRVREECNKSPLVDPNRDVIACAYRYAGGGRCDIWMVDDDELKRRNTPYDIVFRHEQGHCNGWKHDSTGTTLK